MPTPTWPTDAEAGAPGDQRHAVAVIVPTHGRIDLLRESLRSVADQTLPPTEVVVVDDLGDPATAAVVEEFRAVGFPVRLVVEPHGAGVARSRNVGLGTTSSALVAFLDDDDRWAPLFLERAVAALGAAEAGFAVCWTNYFNPAAVWPGTSMPSGLTAAEVVAVNPGLTGTNAVYRRSALDRVGGFDDDLWVSNDKDLLVRLLDAGVEYVVVEERLADRRLHATRLGTDTRRREEGMRRYLAKHRDRLTRRQRRLLRGRIERVIRHRTSGRVQRVVRTIRMVSILGVAGVREVRRADAETRDPGGGCGVEQRRSAPDGEGPA